MMQTWKGWTAAMPTTRTWAEWCAWHQRTLRADERSHAGVRFTAEELAHLSFVRWRYQTGHLRLRGHDSV